MRLQRETPHVFSLFIANSLYCILGWAEQPSEQVAVLVPGRLDISCSKGTALGCVKRWVRKPMSFGYKEAEAV